MLLYLAAWLVIPGEHDEESIAVEALRGRRDQPWLLLGVGLLAFGALFALSEARFWPGTGNVWLAATLVGGAIVWWHVSNRARAPAGRSAASRSGRRYAGRASAGARPRRRRRPPRAAAAGEAVALRPRARGAARNRGPVRPPRRARHLRRRRRRRARGRCRDRRRRDRGRSDDAAPRRWARRPRADPAGRVRRRRSDARLGLVGRRREGRAPASRRCTRATSSASATSSSTSPSSRGRPARRRRSTPASAVGHLVITVPDGVGARDRRPRRSRRGRHPRRDATTASDAHRTISLPGSSTGRARARPRRSTSASATSRCGAGEHDAVSAAARAPAPPARTKRGSALGGVCAGIGKSLRVDPTLVRLTFALLAFAGGAGVVAYAGAWLATRARERPGALIAPAAARLRRARRSQARSRCAASASPTR